MADDTGNPEIADAKATSAAARALSDGTFFIGKHELSVDSKGRLMIPAEIRKELAEANETTFMMIPGANGRPWLYPEGFYRSQIAPAMLAAVPDPDHLAYAMMVYSSATRLKPDKVGRVVLPAGEERDAMGKELVLIGVREHLQLWRRDEWAEHEAAARREREQTARRFGNRSVIGTGTTGGV